VVNDIKMKIKNGMKPSEISILFRSRRYPVFIEQILITEQIDYHIQKSQKLFDREEIKSVIAYLRLAINPDDNLAFEQVCNYPRRRNGEKFLNQVKTYAHVHKCSYLEAMGYIVKLSSENQKFINIIKSMRQDMAKLTIPHTVIHRLSSMLNLEEKLMLEHGPEEGIERHDALQVLIIMLDKISRQRL
jgi:DNA helicase-2/ATP-dependent DNA helicase PcrA